MNKVLWLWVDGKLMKESFLLWNCQANLSNWSSMTIQWQFQFKFNVNPTWNYMVPLPPDPLYRPVQTGSDAKNMGIIGFFSFSTRNPQNRDFSELNGNPTMSAWVYLKNIYFVTKELLGIWRSSEYEVRRLTPWGDLALLIISWVPLGSSLACKTGTISPALLPKRIFCKYQVR